MTASSTKAEDFRNYMTVRLAGLQVKFRFKNQCNENRSRIFKCYMLAKILPKKSSKKIPFQKNLPKKIPPEKSLKNPKNYPQKIQRISEEFPKNFRRISKEFPKNFSAILKISNSLHRTWRSNTISGLCFFKLIISFTFFLPQFVQEPLIDSG